jgi:hypothetical protein
LDGLGEDQVTEISIESLEKEIDRMRKVRDGLIKKHDKLHKEKEETHIAIIKCLGSLEYLNRRLERQLKGMIK